MTHIKQFTRAAAVQLQEDNLALTLQLWAESLMRVLVFMYVAGVMAGEVVRPLGRTLVQPFFTQLGELFTYKIPQMGDVTDAAQQETINAGGIN